MKEEQTTFRGLASPRLLDSTLQELSNDPNVLGVLLVGSWARGDALAGSDVDLEVLVRVTPARRFQLRRGSEQAEVPAGAQGPSPRAALVVEIRFLELESWRDRLRTNPMALYSFLDGRILFQRDHELQELSRLAEERFRAFQWSKEEVASALYWLESTRLKVRAAQEEGDSFRAALVLSTSLWTTLEGLWMVNGLPMPPAGGVVAHLDDLELTPPEFRSDLQGLLLGGSLVAGLRIVDWVTQELRALSGK